MVRDRLTAKRDFYVKPLGDKGAVGIVPLSDQLITHGTRLCLSRHSDENLQVYGFHLYRPEGVADQIRNLIPLTQFDIDEYFI